MKLILVVHVNEEIAKTQMFGIKYMPVWAYTLISHLRKNVNDLEISLYDTRVHPKEKIPEADLYLLSGINQDFDYLENYNLWLKAKYPKSKLVLGGPITTSFEAAGKIEKLKTFDAIYLGDGERGVCDLIEKFRNGKKISWYNKSMERFYIGDALPMDYESLKDTISDYYGGVVEVSRGCPFLCEFCDIRTLQDNNKANNKPMAVIIEELRNFHRLGVTNILFACDNFIGDPYWAEALCDEIILLKEQGAYFSIYTWLTINLCYHPRLMDKLKKAGFEMFFIGVESFGANQLLETAKIQNSKVDMSEAIKTIQTQGFIVVAGLIFGFDSDSYKIVNETLKGILKSGLISGDPSLLMALPGTPLYFRMKNSNRLRDSKLGLGGHKYCTNIKYLKSKEVIISEFIDFVDRFNAPAYQYARFKSFIDLMTVPIVSHQGKKTAGYIDINKLWKLVSKEPLALFSFFQRLFVLLRNPYRVLYIMKAYLLLLKNKNAKTSQFLFWVFNWSNSLIKYSNLNAKDFDIESIGEVVEENLSENLEIYKKTHFEPIPKAKIEAQRRLTVKMVEIITQKHSDILNKTIVLIPSFCPDDKLIDQVNSLKSFGVKNILIVDDGSPHKHFYQQLSEDGVYLKYLDVNQGKGAALRAGLEYIREMNNFEYVVTCDSDGQHAPVDVLQLIRALGELDKNELVLGVRSFDANTPWKSILGNRLASILFGLIYRMSLKDTQTGLRAFKTSLIDEFLDLPGEQYSYEASMLVYVAKRKYPILQIPIKTIYFNKNKKTFFRPFVDSGKVIKRFLIS